ncbi:hypothetical protein [Quadrisphaera sp. KR29]|uniref:hypothetical protein n=1 Tax=Quadrisphaera sp. KR29 TaxID=3461391 RepID=UPI004044A65C
MSPAAASTTGPVAGGAPEGTGGGSGPRTPAGAAASLLVAVLLVVVPTGAALASAALPLPSPSAGATTTPPPAPGDSIPVPPASPSAPAGPAAPADPAAPGPPAAGAGPADGGVGTATALAACPRGLLGWLTSPYAADDCLAATLAESVGWLFSYTVTAVTTYVAFNPLRGSYWQVYLWHWALLSAVALVVAVVRWLVSMVLEGAVEGVRSAGRSFALLAVGLPAAFSVPFFVLLVDAGVLAVTGAFAGVFALRVTELTTQLSAGLLLGDSPGALLAAVLLSAFLFPLLLVVLFAFVLRQIAVYAIPVFGQFGLLPAIAGDGGQALRSYVRVMAGTLLFPLQVVDLLVIGVSFLDFSTLGEGFVTLLYLIGVVLFALIGGSLLSLLFGTAAGSAAYAGARARGRRGRWRAWRPLRAERRERPSRLEGTRLGALAGARWDQRREDRERQREQAAARRSRANPLYWVGRAPSAGSGAPTGPGPRDGGGRPSAARTHGDRARERRGRRVAGSGAATPASPVTRRRTRGPGA